MHTTYTKTLIWVAAVGETDVCVLGPGNAITVDRWNHSLHCDWKTVVLPGKPR